jgi:4'-phosphopantetheinyl transferase EntD
MTSGLRGFRIVPNADVLRFAQHHVSARFEPDPAAAHRNEHLAGRQCAAMALARAGAPSGEVGTNTDGSPIWPAGFIGSITHTRGFASACVSPLGELAGVGIDTEEVLDPAASAEIRDTVATREELGRLRTHSALDENSLLTLVFSAKESVYKCVAPITKEFLEFHDVELLGVDFTAGAFEARILKTPRVPLGALLGRFKLDARLMHTAVELRPSSA